MPSFMNTMSNRLARSKMQNLADFDFAHANPCHEFDTFWNPETFECDDEPAALQNLRNHRYDGPPPADGSRLVNLRPDLILLI